ncbi:MAG: DUF6268 family outer membrane beta-barrel protein [Candidatus Eiseniibacteriota bacterium]|jgi:hypothetical protein
MARRVVRFTPVCAVLALLLVAPAARAQLSLRPERFEVARFQFAYEPKAGIATPRAGTYEEDVDIEVSQADVTLALPWSTANSRTTVVNGLSYTLLDFSYQDWNAPAGEYRPERFHAIRYTLGVRSQLDRVWSATVRVRPGLVSDLEQVDGDHVDVVGGVLLQRTLSRTRAFGVGVSYSNEFGEPLVLPLLEVVWIRSARQKIEILLPRHVRWIFFPSPEVRFSVAAWVTGEHYRIGDRAAPVPNAALDYSLVNLGATFARHLARSVELSVAGGLAMARRFEIEDDGGGRVGDLGLEQRAFIQAGLSYRR